MLHKVRSLCVWSAVHTACIGRIIHCKMPLMIFSSSYGTALAIISSESDPIKSLLFLKNVLVHKQQIMNMWYQEELSYHSTSPVAVIFGLITCRRELLQFTQIPHLSVAPLWLCIVLIWALHMSGQRDKESSPTAKFVHQRAFVMCMCVSVHVDILTHTRTHAPTHSISITCKHKKQQLKQGCTDNPLSCLQ